MLITVADRHIFDVRIADKMYDKFFSPLNDTFCQLVGRISKCIKFVVKYLFSVVVKGLGWGLKTTAK